MLHRSIFLLMLCAWLLPGSVAAEASVGYVNLARLLQEAPQVKRIKAQIREEFRARDQRLVELQKQIAAVEARLRDAGDALTADERERLQTDLASRKAEYQRARNELEQDKQLRFSEEEEKFSRIVREVSAQVAQDRKFDLLLQGGVIWVSPRIDITPLVLARLREMAGEKP